MGAPESSPPPAPIRIIGHGISRTVARFPWTWPLFRGFTRRFFDRVAPIWDTRTASPERMAPLDAALELARVTPRRILDLGTGTGEAAIWLAERFPNASIVGVDLAPKMIEAARERLPEELTGRVRYEVADAGARLPFADAGCDLVALPRGCCAAASSARDSNGLMRARPGWARTTCFASPTASRPSCASRAPATESETSDGGV